MDLRREFLSWISASTSSRRLFAFSYRAVSVSFVLLVVVSLVLRHMGVLVNSVLYQPCDYVQFIGQFRPLLFKRERMPDLQFVHIKCIDFYALMSYN